MNEVNPIFEDYVKKNFGEEVLVGGDFILETPRITIPVSPAMDIGLNGGIPEGSWVSFSGDEKCGKTTTALHLAAHGQREEYGKKIVFYVDIEGRLKTLNLRGIKGLITDKSQFRVIKSEKGKILSGEDFLNLTANAIRNHPGCIVIMDSVSTLCSDSELTGDIKALGRKNGPLLLAAFTRQMANVVPVQGAIVIMIKHLIANTSGWGPPKMEDGGRKTKYQGDVSLRCKSFKDVKTGEKIVGQVGQWDVVYSALGPPGAVITSYIRYGEGIDEISELISIGCDFGLIEKKEKGGWHKLRYLINLVDTDEEIAAMLVDGKKKQDPEKFFNFQGQENLVQFFNENPRLADILYAEIRKMI